MTSNVGTNRSGRAFRSQAASRRRRWAALGLCLALAGLPRDASAQVTEYWPTATGWASASAAEAGMDATALSSALAYGRERGGSGLVARGGRMIGRWGSQTTRYDLKSTTKSFGSILLGVALRDRRVALDTKVALALEAELAAQEPLADAATWVPELTVRHLATHTGGFAKVGGFSPLLFAPGSQWFYSDSGPNWLADLLTVTFMKDLALVLNNRVLRPMAIPKARVVWRDNRYRPTTLRGFARREFGSGISTDVDVMARLGLMLLRDGRWGATRILPPTYADLAGAQAPGIAELPCADPNPEMCPGSNQHYGLLFWNNANGFMENVPRDAYWSAGLGTSFILVIPSLDIVAARAGPKWPAREEPTEWATEPFFELLAAAVSPSG